MANLTRTKMRVGEPIIAPGAPKGYCYGDTVTCPQCDHKSMVYRPRKKMWICTYSSTVGARCLYSMPTYVQRTTMIRNHIGGKQQSGDMLGSHACGDLVVDILGDDLALQHVDEICGSGNISKSRRSGNSSGSTYSNEKMKKYRQKYLTAV